ncbi:MAG: NDP-sugar synthase [Rhodocyclaceae bacterium]|nr:NDP-sugar synthase [Rhodocyclaceae bacterium]MDZ4216511.1 NDP-sugar synthase [Rhodocyclaceae bacterium]
MKALILAAGRGTRVRPLTDLLPKPMIPIINKPVMAFLVEHLKRFGIDRIMVNTSYLSAQIEHYFRDGTGFGVEMAYSFEGRLEDNRLIDEPLGSAGAIRKIHNHSGFFDETFIVLCGDALIDLDIGELLEFHRRKGALATIALLDVPREDVSSYGVVVRDENGRITEFQEKPRPEEAKSSTINTGIYIFEPEVLRHIPETGAFDIGSQLFPALAKAGKLYGLVASMPWQWLDIGQVPDFHSVTMKAMQGGIDGFSLPGRQVRPGVWMGLNVRANLDRCLVVPPAYIGGSAEIQDGATLIGPVAIGNGAVIEAGAHVESSIVMDYTRVGSQTYCRNKILGGAFCVDADGTVLDVRHTDTSWLFQDARTEAATLNPIQANVLADIQHFTGPQTTLDLAAGADKPAGCQLATA